MVNHHEFHDGSFDGLWVNGTSVHVFLSTVRGEGFVALATGVKALAAGGFRPGNIIFEVLTREHMEVTAQDIAELYDLAQGPGRAGQCERLLSDVNRLSLKVLEINPSYGGMCLALADSIDLIPRDDWKERFLTSHPAGETQGTPVGTVDGT
jgi:hypothetical protein